MPTSLGYIDLLARGVLPWRPAAVFGTGTRHKQNRGSTPPGYQVAIGTHPTQRTSSLCSSMAVAVSLVGAGPQHVPTEEEKITLPGMRRCEPTEPAFIDSHLTRFGVRRGKITIPWAFAQCGVSARTQMLRPFFKRGRCHGLSPRSNPWTIAVRTETFSTPAFKRPARISATTTKICTCGCSTSGHPVGFAAAATPPYSRVGLFVATSSRGRVPTDRLSDIHFLGQPIRQVSCYALLSGCQLP